MLSVLVWPVSARCIKNAWAVGLLWLALAGATARADEDPEQSNFLAASWHTEHGLPDGNITALAQTADGYRFHSRRPLPFFFCPSRQRGGVQFSGSPYGPNKRLLHLNVRRLSGRR
jgi:hypothetical protein